MKKKSHPDLDTKQLEALSKAQLIKIIFNLRERLHAQADGKEKRIVQLTEQLASLNQEREEQKNNEINRHVNEPSSKKPEWDKDGNPKKKRIKKRKKRAAVGM